MNVYKKLIRKEVEKIYPQLVINCQKTCGMGYEKWGHDLLPLCIEMFLSKTVYHQLKVIRDGKLENYITFMLGLQLKSSSSRFYHHHRKETNKYREWLPHYAYKVPNDFFPEPFEDEEDPVITCLNKVKASLPPFERMVVNRHIINGEKYIDLSKEFDIPYYAFKLVSNKIKKLMKESCGHFR